MVTDYDIEQRKKDLEERRKQKYESEKEKARQIIVDRLARGNGNDVLELSQRYSIDLPSEKLRELASEYERDGTSSETLRRAQRAYEKLGETEKAKNLEKRIENARDIESNREIFEAMTR